MNHLKGILIIFWGGIFSPQISYCQNTDLKWSAQINQSRTKAKDAWVYPISQSIYPLTIGIPITELSIGYFKKDPILFKKGISTLGAVSINYVSTKILKESINRNRPFIDYPNDISAYYHPSDPSFPSGHSSGAFTIATIVSINYPKWYVIVPSYIWASSIAYSRVYLGVHYVSDVAFGAFLGAGSAIGSHYLNNWFYKKYNYTKYIRLVPLNYKEEK